MNQQVQKYKFRIIRIICGRIMEDIIRIQEEDKKYQEEGILAPGDINNNFIKNIIKEVLVGRRQVYKKFFNLNFYYQINALTGIGIKSAL